MTEELTVPASATRAAQELRVVVSRLRRRLRETSDRREITPSQAAVLSRLARDGTASTSELAAAEGVRAQSMAVSVGVLVERGMVARRPDPADGRRQAVSLTAEGEDYVGGRRAAGEEWLAATLAERFDEDERATLLTAIALLERVVRP